MCTSANTNCTPSVNPVTSGSGPLTAVRSSSLTVTDAIDRYMAVYAGSDPALAFRMQAYRTALGAHVFAEITDDVFAVLPRLEAQPGR